VLMLVEGCMGNMHCNVGFLVPAQTFAVGPKRYNVIP